MRQRRPKPSSRMPHPILALPPDWSAEQALAVFDLIDELRDRVWDTYGPQIQQALREQRFTAPANSSPHLDDPPF